MKRLSISSLTLLLPLAGIALDSQTADVRNSLRAPAYPLMTIDPYMSAWSPTDNLYDSAVMHWTGDEMPLIGVLKVDGVPYRFMGSEDNAVEIVAPTAVQAEWHARWADTKPAEDWFSTGFDDSVWKHGNGAFGDMGNEAHGNTPWKTPHIWIRREADIPEGFSKRPVTLEYSHFDDAVFYINGIKVLDTGKSWGMNKSFALTDEARLALRPGKNIIAVECGNANCAGFIDFGLSASAVPDRTIQRTAIQTSADVQATQTHYTFTCGPVEVSLDFMAPLFLDSRDYDLLSRPVNYISYKVKANDGKEHAVGIYFEASPQWASNQERQKVTSTAFEHNGVAYLKAGTTEQNILGRRGDHVRIDWGYFYLAAPSTEVQYGVGSSLELRKKFLKGKSATVTTEGENENGQLAIFRNLGKTKEAEGMIMVGYDDLYSVQYFGDNLRPYWNRNGDRTIESQFELAYKDFPTLRKRCMEFDRRFMRNAMEVGGKNYAELCALAYRQAIAAHKLVLSPDGELMFFSKENDSNGSIGTVDIAYPSAPLFLYYNPELAEALVNHIFDYTEKRGWNKPFPAHDVGIYPQANWQTYDGDMPVEEAGNMLILTAAIVDRENDASYAARHWEALSTWVDYLVEYGLDPENQLCTDDFAGHFAHNANLSAKAIIAIGAYAKMAERLGKKEAADKYLTVASDYAQKWKQRAADGDHYRLTFDKESTWSQKYNLVWDELLGLNLFPLDIIPTEIKYYLTRQNEYGLPLDSREQYTKTDWVLWTAAMAANDADFQTLTEPVHRFYNETTDRVPMSDWVWTDKPSRKGFMARSVVGGFFIKHLKHRKEIFNPDFYIYLCIGQSNMEGNAPVESCDTTDVSDRFKVMATATFASPEREIGEWYTAVPPLVRDNTGLTPMDYFGRTMVAYLPDSISVGVLPVAVGGCRIEHLSKGFNPEEVKDMPDWFQASMGSYDNRPYDRLIACAREAQRYGVIKGILLHQGESNDGDPEWHDKVKKLYDDILSDLGLPENSLPLLAGEVVTTPMDGGCGGMNNIIDALPFSLPYAHVISSANLPHKGDRLHFTSDSYRRLGRRYAVEMLSLMGVAF